MTGSRFSVTGLILGGLTALLPLMGVVALLFGPAEDRALQIPRILSTALPALLVFWRSFRVPLSLYRILCIWLGGALVPLVVVIFEVARPRYNPWLVIPLAALLIIFGCGPVPTAHKAASRRTRG